MPMLKRELRHTKTNGSRVMSAREINTKSTFINVKIKTILRVTNTRRISQIKLKLMFSPLGLREPTSKISRISCCFRLVLPPLHCFRPQTVMSSSECEGELKCSATGKPGEWLRMLRKCSLKRSRMRLPVSPMYRMEQRRQTMQ